MINFSISYRFGKLKASVKKTETTIDNSDVVGGITNGKIENDLHTYIKVLKSIIYTIFSELLNLHKTYIIPT